MDDSPLGEPASPGVGSPLGAAPPSPGLGSPSASPLGGPQNTWGQAAGQQAPKKQGSSKKKWIIIGSSGGGALIVLVVVLILVLGGGGKDDGVASPGPDSSGSVTPIDPPLANTQNQRKLSSVTTIRTFAISPDGKQIVTCEVPEGSDRVGGPPEVIALWDLESGNQIRELERNVKPINLTFSADGIVVFGELHGGLRVWDVQTGKVIGDQKIHGAVKAGLGPRTLSHDKQWVSAWGHPDALVVNVKTGEVKKFAYPARGAIDYLAFSPVEPVLAVAVHLYRTQAKIELYDVQTFSKTRTVDVPLPDISNMAFSADGKTVVAAAGNGYMAVLDTTDWTVRALTKRTDQINGYREIAVSSDGSRFATRLSAGGGNRHSVEFWTVAAGTLRRVKSSQAVDIQLAPNNSIAMAMEGRPLGFYDMKSVYGSVSPPSGEPLAASPSELLIGSWKTKSSVIKQMVFNSDGSARMNVPTGNELCTWKLVSETKIQATVLVKWRSGKETTYSLTFFGKDGVQVDYRIDETPFKFSAARIDDLPLSVGEGSFAQGFDTPDAALDALGKSYDEGDVAAYQKIAAKDPATAAFVRLISQHGSANKNLQRMARGYGFGGVPSKRFPAEIDGDNAVIVRLFENGDEIFFRKYKFSKSAKKWYLVDAKSEFGQAWKLPEKYRWSDEPARVFKVTAKEFGAEFKKDHDAALAKYKGSVVEITGLVKDVGQHISGEHQLILEHVPFHDVYCFMKEKYPWNKGSPGQTVKLKGRPSAGGRLMDCVIIEATGDPCPALTADELGKEFATSSAATKKKYDRKYMILSGEIAKVGRDGTAHVIYLKNSTKFGVTVTFHPFVRKKQTQALKVGQSIKVIGRYIYQGADNVGLYLCLMTE
ncbi:MAG: WD40 repeat domain-containing protein [Planctomycetes bacterium]|nr:WD40 repeat domain-containing protein [Planctomycetota bacterium]